MKRVKRFSIKILAVLSIGISRIMMWIGIATFKLFQKLYAISFLWFVSTEEKDG